MLIEIYIIESVVYQSIQLEGHCTAARVLCFVSLVVSCFQGGQASCTFLLVDDALSI